MEYFWRVLGIDPTTDLRKIKQAYAQQSRQYHPEEFPEKFQSIQEAYKEAMAWRKRQVAHAVQAPAAPDLDSLLGQPEATRQGYLGDLELPEVGQSRLDFDQFGHSLPTIRGDEESESVTSKTNAPIDGSQLNPESKNDKNVHIGDMGLPNAETDRKSVKPDINQPIDGDQSNSWSKNDGAEPFININLLDNDSWLGQSMRLRRDDIFQLGVENTYEKIHDFLDTIDPLLEKGVTLSLFRRLLNMAQSEKLLSDPDFKVAFSDILIVHMRDSQVRPENVQSMLMLSKSSGLTGFEAYLEELEFQRKSKGALTKEENRSLNWKYFRYTCLIFLLIGSLIAIMPTLTPSSSSTNKTPSNYQRVQSSSTKTDLKTNSGSSYSYTPVPSSDTQKVRDAIDEVVKSIPKTVTDTITVTYDSDTHTYSIENSATGNKQAIPNAKDVMVLDVEENGKREKAIVMTTDDKTWQLLSDDGQVRGTITGTDQLTASSVITIVNGQIAVKPVN